MYGLNPDMNDIEDSIPVESKENETFKNDDIIKKTKLIFSVETQWQLFNDHGKPQHSEFLKKCLCCECTPEEHKTQFVESHFGGI